MPGWLCLRRALRRRGGLDHRHNPLVDHLLGGGGGQSQSAQQHPDQDNRQILFLSPELSPPRHRNVKGAQLCSLVHIDPGLPLLSPCGGSKNKYYIRLCDHRAIAYIGSKHVLGADSTPRGWLPSEPRALTHLVAGLSATTVSSGRAAPRRWRKSWPTALEESRLARGLLCAP